MQFNPHDWQKAKSNAPFPFEGSRLQLRAEKPVALFITANGVEALVGHGVAFDVRCSGIEGFRCTGTKETEIFVFAPFRIGSEPTGEVLTNMDRQPMESGNMAAISIAMRRLELQTRQSERRIRKATRDARLGQSADRPESEETELDIPESPGLEDTFSPSDEADQ